MTESEWLACPDVHPLLNFLRQRHGPDSTALARKFRLYACACVRQMWAVHGMGTPAEQDVVAVAERYAERQLTHAEVHRFRAVGMSGPARKTLLRSPRMAANDVRGRDPFLFRCILGNPFRIDSCDPAWLTSTVVGLAEAIYAERAFDRLPILADALQEAGCENERILAHCRDDGVHARGCWVVDLLLGKE